MEKDKIIEYLQSNCMNAKEISPMLEQFKDKNYNFLIELLLHLKGSNLDLIEKLLDNERQIRASLTDILTGLSIRDQFLCQLCKYISTWNLFNKILEIEDEKERTNKEIRLIVAQIPVAKRTLFYLRDNSREDSLNISRNIGYSQGIVERTLALLCDKDIIYKISIGDKAIYDLTENGRIWIDKNADGYKTDIINKREIQHEEIRLKYKLINNVTAIESYILENIMKFESIDKFQYVINCREGIEKIERKKVAGVLEGISRY